MTESREYPKVQRLQGCILVPCEIEPVERDGNIFYRYKLLRIEDRGQNINDPDFFKKHYQELRREYILQSKPVHEQLEAIAEAAAGDNKKMQRLIGVKANAKDIFAKTSETAEIDSDFMFPF